MSTKTLNDLLTKLWTPGLALYDATRKLKRGPRFLHNVSRAHHKCLWVCVNCYCHHWHHSITNASSLLQMGCHWYHWHQWCRCRHWCHQLLLDVFIFNSPRNGANIAILFDPLISNEDRHWRQCWSSLAPMAMGYAIGAIWSITIGANGLPLAPFLSQMAPIARITNRYDTFTLLCTLCEHDVECSAFYSSRTLGCWFRVHLLCWITALGHWD